VSGLSSLNSFRRRREVSAGSTPAVAGKRAGRATEGVAEVCALAALPEPSS